MDALEMIVQFVGLVAAVAAARLLVTAVRAVLLAAITLLSAVVPLTASGADCRQFFTYQYAYAAPVVYPQVYYAAGKDIEAEALAAKVAKLVASQLRAELTATPKGLGHPVATRQSALAQHCAKCHSGANPKGGITIDGVTPMRCEQILAAIRAVADGSMPKGLTQVLSPQVKGQLLEELLALEHPADRQPPVPIPEPDESGVLK